ncbi:MAG TPA: MnhB domain-containing protein [Acidimicrobiales bacterium]|nr:MnhB domain-containing protein [Acidimicrobiales bacterium]
MRFRRSLVLDVGVRVTFHTVLLFSLFLLFAGHNAPGGGFIGGLVAGAAFMLRYVGGGADEVQRIEPVTPEVLLGTGVIIAVLTGMASLVFGGDFLQSGYHPQDLPLLGKVSFTSVLVFDIGVYLVVVGLVVGVLRSLGREETEGEAAPAEGGEAAT